MIQYRIEGFTLIMIPYIIKYYNGPIYIEEPINYDNYRKNTKIYIFLTFFLIIYGMLLQYRSLTYNEYHYNNIIPIERSVNLYSYVGGFSTMIYPLILNLVEPTILLNNENNNIDYQKILFKNLCLITYVSMCGLINVMYSLIFIMNS